MRATSVVGAAVLFLAGSAIVAAGEIESGISVGGRIGAYQQTKCSGDDGFGKEGDSFCYT